MNQIIQRNSLWKRLHIDLTLFVLIFMILLYGIFVLWSASGQNYEIILQRLFQIITGLLIMVLLAQIPPRIYEILAPYIYLTCLILLVVVNIFGKISKGAQRWLEFGMIRFQPSEIIKISVLLAVAYYINRSQYPPSIKTVMVALLLTSVPTIFVILQPDLGTAILTASSGLFVLFLSGISWKLIIFTILLIFFSIPIFWFFFYA